MDLDQYEALQAALADANADVESAKRQSTQVAHLANSRLYRAEAEKEDAWAALLDFEAEAGIARYSG